MSTSRAARQQLTVSLAGCGAWVQGRQSPGPARRGGQRLDHTDAARWPMPADIAERVEGLNVEWKVPAPA